jgi:hypothetical protein
LTALATVKRMARIYAGILGLLAFATVVARGVAHESSLNSTVWMACSMLFVFAAVGSLIGGAARWIVDDSVRGELASRMAAKQTAEPGN